jgi:hypothetical protein
MGAAATHSLRVETMRHLLILACLLFGTGAVADEGDFDFKSLGAKKALRDYKATLAKEDKAKQKAIEEIEAEAKKERKKYRVELIMNLEQALKKALQDADLEEANKIDAAIKALKKGNVSLGDRTPTDDLGRNKDNFRASAMKSQINRLLGKRVKFITGKDLRTIILSRDGKVVFPDGNGHANESRWKVDKSDRLLLLHSSGRPSAIMSPIDIGDGKVRYCGPFMFGPNLYHAIEAIR